MFKHFHLLSIVFAAAMLFPVCGRADTKEACGRVFDSFTRELLIDVQIDVLSKTDSALIATFFSKGVFYAFDDEANIDIDSIPEEGAILYLRKEGYYPQYLNVPKMGKTETLIELKPVLMDRVPFFKSKRLNEVTVTASRVKMVMKGDTIVYNADAFALAQGSMLDGLIDQLPGVELKNDGRILVNGKFVSELLVNGDRLFKGDPKIALENMPAYMVKDIKVFRRDDKADPIPLEKQPLIMDVKLKKQYETGWIANAEAGYGTSNRYLGRLFGLMFTRSSRLALVGNINNTNDDRKPGQTDNWNPDWQSAGRATIATCGVDFIWNSRLRSWKVEANVLARHKKSDISSNGTSECYLSDGNLTGKRTNTSLSRQWRITSDNRIRFRIPRLKVEFMPTASFVRERASGESESRTSDSYGNLLNSMTEVTATYRRYWSASANLVGLWKLPLTSYNLKLGAWVKWTGRTFERTTDRLLLFPQQPEQNETARPQELLPERTFEARTETPSFSGNYNFSKVFHGNYGAKYYYNHNRVNSSRDYYLRQPQENMLPSVTDAIQHAGFIPSNSYDYSQVEDRHLLELHAGNFFPHLKGRSYQPNIGVKANIIYQPGHIRYEQGGQVYRADRKPLYVEPSLSCGIDNFMHFSYTYSAMLPSLRDLLDVTDAANPLNIFLGNSKLKTARTHGLRLDLFAFAGKGINMEVRYNKHENLVAQSASYDMATGVTTYRPVNVNGNWDVNGELRYNRKFGNGETWRLTSATRALYQNSVDMIGLTLNTVRNFNLSEKLRLTYKIASGMELTANGNVEWRKVTSPMAGFNPISAVDFDYGLIFRATKLPWDMSFTTDLMMHSRRGYADSRLNTNDLVWNARLAKSILNGNLTFAIDGFDILGNLSNVRLVMNSQGRTETRYNTLPRYAMLHVIYRLNLQPKKK